MSTSRLILVGGQEKAGVVMLRSTVINGPRGRWILVADNQQVVYLGFPGERPDDVYKLLRLPKDVAIADHGVPPTLVRAVTLMLNKAVPLPARDYQLRGTDFQHRVWAALRAIPRGQTRTYTDIARAIEQPTAVRAVAHAVATNPLPLVVPCHRVVPAAGGVGQYRGGSKLKAFLLSREGSIR